MFCRTSILFTIDHPIFSNCAYTSAGGGILFDLDGGNINAIEISNIEEYDCTDTDHDSGAVNFYSGGTTGSYIIRDCLGYISHVMRGSMNSLVASNCQFLFGTASYHSFMADKISISNSTLKQSANSNGSFCYGVSGTVANFINCEILPRTADTNDSIQIYGDSISVYFANTKLYNMQINFNDVGSFVSAFDNCTFLGFGTDGAIKTNYGNPTRQELFVRMCRFVGDGSSSMPVNTWNYNPNVFIIQNNTYNTTLLYATGFGSPYSDVNNVYTP